jgi:hypothetical protein
MKKRRRNLRETIAFLSKEIDRIGEIKVTTPHD